MKETIQQVLDVITPIPEDKWTIKYHIDDKGRRCFYGHLNEINLNLSKKIREIGNNINLKFTSVNDGDDKKYQQNTPKQRVIAALNDLLI